MTKEEKKTHGFELFHKASEGFDKHFYQISESDLNKFTSQFQSVIDEQAREIERLHYKIAEMNGHQELHYEEQMASKEVIDEQRKELENLKAFVSHLEKAEYTERQGSQKLYEAINEAGNMEVDTPALYQLLISQIKLTLRKALNDYESTQPGDTGVKQETDYDITKEE